MSEPYCSNLNSKFEQYIKNKEYQSLMNAAASKYLRHKVDIDELESIKMYALWKAIKKYNIDHISSAKFTTFLYGSMKLECKNYNRQQNKIKKYKSENYCEHLQTKNSHNNEINELLDCLRFSDKELIIDRFLENMTLQELSTKYGVSHETIRKKINRIISELQCLKN